MLQSVNIEGDRVLSAVISDNYISGATPERPEDELKNPNLRRLIVNDATFEAAHHTTNELIRDELAGWWSALDGARPGR